MRRKRESAENNGVKISPAARALIEAVVMQWFQRRPRLKVAMDPATVVRLVVDDLRNLPEWAAIEASLERPPRTPVAAAAIRGMARLALPSAVRALVEAAG